MFGRSQIYFMSKLKKYLIVTTASLLAVSGLFYIVNNYDSDYLNRGLADIFSIKKAFAVQAGCTQGPCIQTVDPSPYCSSTGCTSYGCTSTGCTAYNDPPPYCASFGCTSFGCVARNSKGQCVAGGCTGYGCTRVVDPPPQCVATGCTSYGCTGYGCTGYTDPSPYCSAYGPDICPVNGFCGSSVNSCSTGSFVDITDSSTYYLWNCNGFNGGATASCSYPKTPVCGTVNSCNPGTFSDVTDGGGLYKWKCVNGSLSVNCSATQATVSTIPATNISATSATLKGTINTNGVTGLYYKFCLNNNWWCTSSQLITPTVLTSASFNVSSLSAGTAYTYTIVITDSIGNILTTSNTTSFTTKYSFKVTKTGSGLGTVTAIGGINCGSSCQAIFPYGTTVFPQVTPASGSVFTGWKSVEQGGDCPFTALCPIRMADKDVTVTANFEASKTLTVNKTKDVAGTVTSSPVGIKCGISCGSASKSYPYNTTVILKAFPSTSYNFSSWSGCNSSSGNSCTVNVNGDKTVTANFTVTKKYDLKISKSGKGTGYVTISKTGLSNIKCKFNNIRTSSCTGKYANDGKITLTATANPGSEFASWGGVCVGKSPCSISVDSPKDVTAYFNKI